MIVGRQRYGDFGGDVWADISKIWTGPVEAIVSANAAKVEMAKAQQAGAAAAATAQMATTASQQKTMTLAIMAFGAIGGLAVLGMLGYAFLKKSPGAAK